MLSQNKFKWKCGSVRTLKHDFVIIFTMSNTRKTMQLRATTAIASEYDSTVTTKSPGAHITSRLNEVVTGRKPKSGRFIGPNKPSLRLLTPTKLASSRRLRSNTKLQLRPFASWLRPASLMRLVRFCKTIMCVHMWTISHG